MNFTRLLVIALITNLWFAEDAYPAYPYTLSERYANGDGFMRVRLLGALELPFSRLNGHDLVELSGLAWDHDEQMLYAISDHGHLFHLRPTIEQEFLTEVEVLDAFSLDSSGRVGPERGCFRRGGSCHCQPAAMAGRETRSWSFHLKDSPASTAIPRPESWCTSTSCRARVLEQAYRGSNSGFESVTFLPSTGILTGPERPIENPQSEVHSLFDLNGKRWTLPRFPAPNSALVAIEAMPDESLITLERSFVSVWQPLRIILRQTTPLQLPRRSSLQRRPGGVQFL